MHISIHRYIDTYIPLEEAGNGEGTPSSAISLAQLSKDSDDDLAGAGAAASCCCSSSLIVADADDDACIICDT